MCAYSEMHRAAKPVVNFWQEQNASSPAQQENESAALLITLKVASKQSSASVEGSNATIKSLYTYHPETEEILEGKPLFFMHIPMNFGSTVEDLGAVHDMRWGSYKDAGRVRMRDGWLCHKSFIPPYLLEVPSMYTDQEVFTIVRHPYERVVSEYKHLMSVEWGDAWGTELFQKQPCSADSLNNWIQKTVWRFMRGERYINDCHMLPQMEYIQGTVRRYAKWELGDVLHAEKLPAAFDELMKRRNHPVRLTGATLVNSNGDVCPELAVKDLTTQSKSMLNTAYYEDFQKLHYQMDGPLMDVQAPGAVASEDF